MLLGHPSSARVPARREGARAVSAALLCAAAAKFDEDDEAQLRPPELAELAPQAPRAPPRVCIVRDGSVTHGVFPGLSIESLQWAATRRGDLLAEVLSRDAGVVFEWVTARGAPCGPPVMFAPLREWVGEDLARAHEERIMSEEPLQAVGGAARLFEWCAELAALVRASAAERGCGVFNATPRGDWAGPLELGESPEPRENPPQAPRGAT